MKPSLIYAYDPLCGWCFGFHPVIKKLVSRFYDQLNFKVIPGGLATGHNIREIREDQTYILSSLSQVEERTGVEFGENFKLLVEEGSYIYNSEPSCRIQNVVNELCPEHSLEFAGELHKAFFVEGKNLNQWKTFEDLLTRLRVDTGAAKTLFRSEKQKKYTTEKFKWCTKNGATAFPTLLLKIGDEIGIMSRGYRPYDILESHLHHLLNNIQKIQG